jgi:hypothetical protein
VAEIEKLEKGLSKNSSVRDALRKANEELEEGKMKDIFTADQEGESAAEIAKRLKLPLSTVKKILGEEVEQLIEKIADKIIKDLQKAYAPMKGKTISPEMATRMSKHLDQPSYDLTVLRQLHKANIPFISTLARNKIYKKTGKFEAYLNEQDHEISMARGELEAISNKAQELSAALEGKSDATDGLEAWVQSKITKAKDYINSVSDYLLYNPDIKMEDKEIPPIDKDNAPGVKIAKIRAMDDKDGKEKDKSKDTIENLKDQIAMLKVKLENEKNKAVKPEPNPETGEVPLTIGLAHKLLRDKEKKEDVQEADLSKPQIKKVHKMADELPKKDFKDRYGKEKGDSVRYATATNIVKKKEGIKEQMRLRIESMAALKKKADKSGMPYSILKKVFDRGMAAWKGGHRPGASQHQWAYARVNSFVTKSSGTWGGADKDLAAKVRGSK